MRKTKKSLNLGIGTLLYDDVSNSNDNINTINYTTFDLLNKYLEVDYGYIPCTAFEIIDNKHNLLLMKMSINSVKQSIFQYITSNNDLNSVIINLDAGYDTEIICNMLYLLSYASKHDIEGVSYNSDFTQLSKEINLEDDITFEDWYNFVNEIYEQILYSDTSEWRQFKSKDYKIIYKGRQLKIYGKLDKNNDVLLGFNINSSYYNYFTDKVTNANKICKYTTKKDAIAKLLDKAIKESKEELQNNKSISKCEITINNKRYDIDLEDKMKSTLQIYSNICSKHKGFFTSKDIEFFRVNNFIFRSTPREGLVLLGFKEKNINNILLKDNSGNIINIQALIDKMKVLGVDELDRTYYNNILIYNYIPTNLGFSKNSINTYDYLIEFV